MAAERNMEAEADVEVGAFNLFPLFPWMIRPEEVKGSPLVKPGNILPVGPLGARWTHPGRGGGEEVETC